MVNHPVINTIDRMLTEYYPAGIIVSVRAELIGPLAIELDQPAEAPLLYRGVVINLGTPRLSDWEAYGVVELALPAPEPEAESTEEGAAWPSLQF